MKTDYHISIIGLGYVGLPLVLEFSKYYPVIGYDIDKNRVNQLNSSVDINKDIDIIPKDVLFTHELRKLKKSNIYIITVPTPVDDYNKPDLSYIEDATKSVSTLIDKNDIIIYESTVYPGVTEEICVPILEKYSSLKYNVDFYCGYSPERISPGNSNYQLTNVVKITSGSTPEIANVVDRLYSKIVVAGTYKASSIIIAESAKVVENTQRDVNIALMNELAMMFDQMNIKTLDVLDAAKSKPNFLDFKPGLVGGHCISVDPYYLLHKSEKIGFLPNLLKTARNINNLTPDFIVKKTLYFLQKSNKRTKFSSVIIFGYTFKENCSDLRNTMVKNIALSLEDKKINVDIYDPFVIDKPNNNFIENPFVHKKKYDLIIVAVAHEIFSNYTKEDFLLISNGKLVLLDIKGLYNYSTWKL